MNDDNMQINEYLPPSFPDNTYVSLDLELANANEKILHRPTSGKFACLSVCADPGTVYLIKDVDLIPFVLKNLENCIWIFQNAKFDITHLRRWATIPPRAKLWDTMLIEQIMWNGYYSSFALDDLARRYLDLELDKSLQTMWGDIDLTNIPEDYLNYAATDASVTLRICEKQRKIIKKSQFKLWKEVELPVLWAVMDFKGFCIDVDKWIALAEKNKQLADEIDATLPFNPRSYKVVRSYLSEHGWDGLPSTGEAVLEEWMERKPGVEAAELANKILDSRRFSKYASTYGMSWVQDHLECEDGCNMVYGDYHTIGAETGRFSCSNPSMQNVPARDTKDFRECFIARPNHKLIIGDYSQQEIGIAAYVSGDKVMKDIFNSGQDTYIAMAKLMYNIEITKEDPLRSRMKTVFLGTNYGMSAYGLARKEHITEEEAEDVLKRFAKKFPKMVSWMHMQMNKKVKTETMIGRMAWLNPYSGQRERNALNNPIQGTASDMMKMSLVDLRDFLEDSFPVVAVIHDEIILDVHEDVANVIAESLKNVMEHAANTMLPGMNFRATVSIGQNWADKE